MTTIDCPNCRWPVDDPDEDVCPNCKARLMPPEGPVQRLVPPAAQRSRDKTPTDHRVSSAVPPAKVAEWRPGCAVPINFPDTLRVVGFLRDGTAATVWWDSSVQSWLLVGGEQKDDVYAWVSLPPPPQSEEERSQAREEAVLERLANAIAEVQKTWPGGWPDGVERSGRRNA